MGRSDTDARASTSTRRVLVGWGLLFALTTSLAAVAAAPLIALGRPREDMLLLAVQLASRKRGGEGGRLEDVLGAYCRLAGVTRVLDEAFQEKLDELIATGLVARRASGYELTPQGSARVREQVEARGRADGAAR